MHDWVIERFYIEYRRVRNNPSRISCMTLKGVVIFDEVIFEMKIEKKNIRVERKESEIRMIK